MGQSGLKLYDFTILAAGVEPNKFVICSHNGAIMGLFIELKTEFEFEQVISMQFRKRLLLGVVRNARIYHLNLLNTKRNCSQFRGCGRNGKLKTTLKQLGKQCNLFYMASDLYVNIWSLWNTELQHMQVNQ